MRRSVQDPVHVKAPKVIQVRSEETLLPSIIPESARELYGRAPKSKPIPISKVTPDIGSVTIWGEIFSVEQKITRDQQRKIITVNITDYSSSMIILPAIDIKDGECVRLVKGDYATAHKVAENAVEAAQTFQAAGAEWLHMVDLDGAKAAKPVNSKLIFKVLKESKLKVEIGGGIRSLETIDYYIKNGIDRVILGSTALNNPALVAEAVEKYAEKIAVGIDALDGNVAAHGWTETSTVNYIELAKQMEQLGVKFIIFTDISRDGTLSGPNLAMLSLLIPKPEIPNPTLFHLARALLLPMVKRLRLVQELPKVRSIRMTFLPLVVHMLFRITSLKKSSVFIGCRVLILMISILKLSFAR